MKPFLIGLLLGSIAGVFAMQNHLVRTGDGVVVIPRAHRPPLRSTVADVRDWSAAMWEQYPELKAAVVQADRADLLTEGGLGNYLTSTAARRPQPARATHTASDSNLAIRFFENEQPLAPIGANEGLRPQSEQFGVQQPSSAAVPGEAPCLSPFEALLGPARPFPGRTGASDRAEGDRELPYKPSKQSGYWGAAPTPSRPAAGVYVPEHPAAPTPRESNGASADWVRGLLKSLIPSAEAHSPNERADADSISAPPPATAGQAWTPVSLRELPPSQPPLRAVHPF